MNAGSRRSHCIYMFTIQKEATNEKRFHISLKNLQQWNETYLHYHKVDTKQTYYLSMEFRQGRALTNVIANFDIQDAYSSALNKMRHELEEITEQDQDMTLGNGGLGRLASCFLDSMATLNLPTWGYGLRYRYGLIKQCISKARQEEIAEDWLEFSPLEVVRHDVVFPIRFYGRVEVLPTGYLLLSYMLELNRTLFQDSRKEKKEENGSGHSFLQRLQCN
ncbi:unnamed protein product [Lactuca virosa]|uniref:Alpha-1,4 glucan phosphorylase n=1 Tax=Lactuca virosa TaxID=75947 RepID=A0AAU9NRK0_9ASTR|nr:unnamed protein product [Lactuca virosa]